MVKVAIAPGAGSDWLDAITTALSARGYQVRRAELRHLVKSGRVVRDGRPLRLNTPVVACWLELPLPNISPELTPRVLHHDSDLLVVSKPAGLLTHATADLSRPDLVSWVRRNVASDAVLQHRLDRETSGLVLFTLSQRACAPVAQAFAEGRMEKVYLARVSGAPPAQGQIDVALGEVKGRVRVQREGKAAVTAFRRLHQEGGQAWLELRPQQGRKHQLRVHCAYKGWPLDGDELYGGIPADRLWLHAWKLGMRHPAEDRLMHFVDDPGPGWGLP